MTDDIIKRLDEFIFEGEILLDTPAPENKKNLNLKYFVSRPEFEGWKATTLNFLREILPKNSVYLNIFSKQLHNGFAENVKSAVEILKNIKKDFENDNLTINTTTNNKTSIDNILSIFDKFKGIINSLQNRTNSKKEPNKPLIEINDEYDIQYILEILLLAFFDNLKVEESVPSTGSTGSKIDFLLPDEKIAIETKYFRSNMTNKKLGEELNDDIGKYFKHPNCELILFFIYDPNGQIRDYRAFERDFTKIITDNEKIITYICL
ncbi:hypothetical protein LJB96_04090 [Methanobrevibacter sp. OttesenSCG-928-K11]|nr:hypothetical protein [Methanobrevibacter sp. OttesenSCG-928-K11]